MHWNSVQIIMTGMHMTDECVQQRPSRLSTSARKATKIFKGSHQDLPHPLGIYTLSKKPTLNSPIVLRPTGYSAVLSLRAMTSLSHASRGYEIRSTCPAGPNPGKVSYLLIRQLGRTVGTDWHSRLTLLCDFVHDLGRPYRLDLRGRRLSGGGQTVDG